MESFQQFQAIFEGRDPIAHGQEFPGNEFSNVSIPFDKDNRFHAQLRRGKEGMG
jgi:hypothetical protein